MSLLLLFGGVVGRLGVAAALVTLSAPDATLTADAVTLTATPAVLTLTAPAAAMRVTLDAGAGLVTFTAPTATVAVSGVTTLTATPALLTFTTGTPQLTIDVTVPFVFIGGVNRTTSVQMSSLTITDVLDEAPNTATLTVDGTAPVVGQEMVVTVGGLIDRVFAGHLVSVEQVYLGRRENVAWHCTAVDYTRLLDRRLVTKRYESQSVTAIVTNIISTFTSGFTVAHVVAGLPTTADIDFEWEEPTRVLTRLAKLVSASWYVDYDRDIHFFITETVDAPSDITEAQHVVQELATEANLSQARTRVIVRGKGSSALVNVVVGANKIPLDDASAFITGDFATGVQRGSYTGTVAGGAATTVVSGTSGPSSAPSVALSITTSGSIVGTVSYKVSYKNDAGETLPGPPSSTVTGVVFSAPAGAPFASIASGLGRLIGNYNYKITNVNASGETTPGSAAFISLSAVSTPSAPSVSEVASTIGVLIGTYTYKISFLTAYGETLPGSNVSIALAAQTAPAAPFGESGGFNYPGPLIGNYSYKVSFVSVTDEETLGTATSFLTASVITASSPGVSGDGTGLTIAYAVTWVHPVYGESAMSARTIDTNKGTNPVITAPGLPAGCGWNVYTTGTSPASPSTDPLFKVAEMSVGASSFTHTTQTGPAAGVISTMGRYVVVSSIPTGPTGTVARRLYRTKAGGSTYYLVGQIDNNTAGMTFTDPTPDASLTVTAPLGNPNGKQVSLTVPTGPSGVVIARRIWRTKAGGSGYYLVGRIDDNFTTAFLDNTPDDSLTDSAPLQATAGGQSVQLSSIPSGPAGTLARRIYRTKTGGSEYFLVGQISDNVTGTFLDNVADEELGGTVPLVNDAGASAVALTSIPSAPGGITARRIYRTEAGGSVYRFVTELRDASTTYTDTKADSELGDVAPTVATLGATISSTTLNLSDATAFPSAGWARVEGQLISWTGKSGSQLTGIPETGIPGGTPRVNGSRSVGATSIQLAGLASGGTFKAGDSVKFEGHGTLYDVASNVTADGAGNVTITLTTGLEQAVANNALVSMTNNKGAIRSAIQAGSVVITVPMLTGVSGIVYPIDSGDAVNILVERNDTAAQTALAAIEGGNGIHEFSVTDQSLTIEAAEDRGDSELALFSTAERRLTFASRDPKLRSGKSVTVNLGAPTNISGTFKIQQVVLTKFGLPHLLPLRTVTASSYLYTLDHLLRRVELGV